jgi:hypothetical protein
MICALLIVYYAHRPCLESSQEDMRKHLQDLELKREETP